jgi:hypothetical protein
MAIAKALALETKANDQRNSSKKNAAHQIGVSAARISQAIQVLQHLPNLAKEVLVGATTLDVAYDKAEGFKECA